MVSVDRNICKKCGLCISYFKGYCINSENEFPIIDYKICNQCQKCIAICPHQAILMNNTPPIKISTLNKIGYEELISLLKFRRSTKKFIKKDIPKYIITDIALSAKYAPNQNKNIDILIIDDKDIIKLIDLHALKYIKPFYKLIFSIKIITLFVNFFLKPIYIIKKKMEHDLFNNKHIIKKNTNVLLLMIGNPKIPVTEMSAQYLLSTMILTAESLNIGSTLMDSLKIIINIDKKLKKKIGLKKCDKILGVLALGYADEKIMNIPDGYEIKLHWNKIADKSD